MMNLSGLKTLFRDELSYQSMIGTLRNALHEHRVVVLADGGDVLGGLMALEGPVMERIPVRYDLKIFVEEVDGRWVERKLYQDSKLPFLPVVGQVIIGLAGEHDLAVQGVVWDHRMQRLHVPLRHSDVQRQIRFGHDWAIEQIKEVLRGWLWYD